MYVKDHPATVVVEGPVVVDPAVVVAVTAGPATIPGSGIQKPYGNWILNLIQTTYL